MRCTPEIISRDQSLLIYRFASSARCNLFYAHTRMLGVEREFCRRQTELRRGGGLISHWLSLHLLDRMHLLYKVVRAATPNQLYQDFKPVRKVNLSYSQMQQEAQKAVAKAIVGKGKQGSQLGREEWSRTLCDLFIRAAAHGHAEAVSMLLKNGAIPPKVRMAFQNELLQKVLMISWNSGC